MSEQRKILGMTMMQVGILGGLAAAVLLILCVGGVLVMRNANSQGGESVLAPTVVPTVTSVFAPSATIEPTITPTAIPYEQLIPPEWKQYKTSLVEIWLPGNFKLADNKTKDITEAFGVSDLLLTEVSSKSSNYTMLVNVSYDLYDGGSLDEFLNQKYPSTSHDMVFLNATEARRINIQFRLENVDYNNMVYVLKDGNTIWYVEYLAEITEFFENRDTFEQSVKTFRPVAY